MVLGSTTEVKVRPKLLATNSVAELTGPSQMIRISSHNPMARLVQLGAKLAPHSCALFLKILVPLKQEIVVFQTKTCG